jgi:hypothetical protein
MEPYGEIAKGTAQSKGEESSAHEKQASKLRALFPTISDKQRGDIEETLHTYCAVVWRIYDRLERERPEIIDELIRNRRIKGKVDSSK